MLKSGRIGDGGCAFDCRIKNKWRIYKLGEAINPKYAYRKVNKQLHKIEEILDRKHKSCYNRRYEKNRHFERC